MIGVALLYICVTYNSATGPVHGGTRSSTSMRSTGTVIRAVQATTESEEIENYYLFSKS